MSIACCSSACHNVLLRFRAKQQVAVSGVTQLRVTPAPEGFPIGALKFDFFDQSRQRRSACSGVPGGCNCIKALLAWAAAVTAGSSLLYCPLRQLPIQSLSALRLPIAAPSCRVARPWPLKVLTPPQLPRSINRARGAACAGPSSISCQRFAFTFAALLLAPEVLAPQVLAPPHRPPKCAHAHCGMRARTTQTGWAPTLGGCRAWVGAGRVGNDTRWLKSTPVHRTRLRWTSALLVLPAMSTVDLLASRWAAPWRTGLRAERFKHAACPDR